MHLIDQLRADLASAHLRAQAGRFGRLTVVAFGAQVATLGTGHIGWESVAAVCVGAVEVAYRQWVPTVPWKAVTAKLRDLLPGAHTPGPAAVPPAAGDPSAPTGT
jgi:hypothetical protein